jgi:hypothetical protein
MATRDGLARQSAAECRVELKAQKTRRRELMRRVVVALTALLAYEQTNGDEPEALAQLVEDYAAK